jgi:tetratricopeptide (TPR) repeat protein
VLRLLPGELSADAATQLLQSRAGVSDVIDASVRRAGSTWVVRATRTSTSGNAQSVEAHAADPLLAANDVADRLLALFGKSAKASVAAEPSLTELMQRTEAARLGDDLVGARRLIEAAPPSLQRMPEVRLRLAQIDIRAGRFEAALSELHALLDELSAEAEPVLRAQAFYATATALLRTDRYDDALHAFDAGVALADLGSDAAVAARLHMGRGSLEAMTRHYDAALADYARARIAYQLSGDAFTVAWLDGNEGVLQLHRDRPADAVPALSRAEQHFERFGVFNELVTMQGDQIVAQLALLRPAAALAAGERAAPFLDRVRDASVRRLVQLRQALASIANGRTREARTRLDALMQQVDPAHDVSIRGMARLALAQLDLAAGRPTDALAGATQAIDDLLLPDDEADRALAWATRLRALRANHDLAGLRAADSAFDAWKTTRTAPLARLRVTMADAEQAAFDGDDAAARRHYDAALIVANDIATPAALAEVAVGYGEFLIRDGRLEEASVVAGRVARFASDDFGCALLQAHLFGAMGHQAAAVEAFAEARRLAGERAVSALPTAPVVASAPR